MKIIKWFLLKLTYRALKDIYEMLFKDDFETLEDFKKFLELEKFDRPDLELANFLISYQHEKIKNKLISKN